MTVAYVMMKCDLGAEEATMEKLNEMEEVLWVDQIYGAYDLIIKVETGNIEKMKEFLLWNIQKMQKVRSTLTVHRKGS